MSNHHERGEGVEQPNQPAKMCENGCGFFANAACMGYCSKCYREKTDRSQHQVPALPVRDTPRPEVRGGRSADEIVSPAVAVSPEIGFKPRDVGCEEIVRGPALVGASQACDAPLARPTRNRCPVCRKRVGLTGFPCKCGKVFCGEHRYAEAHECSFDHKASERRKIAENNPVVQASKLDRL